MSARFKKTVRVVKISIVKVKNLRKVFEDKEDIVAVDNISFEIEEGEVFGLLGPNGAG